MPYFLGQSISQGTVSIGPPIPSAIVNLVLADDVRDAVLSSLYDAPMSDNFLYFWVYEAQRPVGDILLHDIDFAAGESLVAYHLFVQADRRRGVGKTALLLLQEHVITSSNLTRLVIITSRDNVASQQLARSCGFCYRGSAREDAQLVVFEWNVPKKT